MNRAGIYVYYNKEGILEDYAVYFINSFAEFCSSLTVVVNGKLNPCEKEKIQNGKVKFIVRDNFGYDFWGYREGFLDYGKEKLKQIDEMVFANNSCFGPIYNLDGVFQKTEEKNIDFWGISKHGAVNKNVIKFNPKTKIKEHIQTYFFAVKNKMLNSKEFYDYFLNLKKVKNKKEAIGFIEVAFTDYFKKFGFKYDTFIDDSILKYGIDNYHQYLPYICLKDHNCPFIKKTVFASRYDLAQKESLAKESMLAFDFIKDKTNYDIKLILKEISKAYPPDDIKRFLHLNFTVQNKESRFPDSNKAVVLYNGDLIKNHKTDYCKLEKREISKQLKELSNKYDYLLIENTEIKNLNLYQKESFCEYLLNSMYKNLEEIAGIFYKNPYIGAIYPLPFFGGGFEYLKFSAPFQKNFTGNKNFFEAIPFFVWIKKEAAKKINEKKNINSLTELLHLIQQTGFLSAGVQDSTYNKIYLDNLEYKFIKSNGFLSRLAFKAGKTGGV